MRIGDRIVWVALGIETDLRGLAAASSVEFDPLGIDTPRAGVFQKLLERLGHRSKTYAVDRLVDTIIPFDARLKSHSGDVRATDVGGVAGGRVASGVEEVGFGVEGHAWGAFDDVELYVWAQLKQILEGLGLGHIEIIASDDPNAALAFE